MPGFRRQSLAMGFDFGDEDEDNTATHIDDYDDDLADSESNAEDEEPPYPPSRRQKPAAAPRSSTTGIMVTSTPAPEILATLAPTAPDEVFVPSESEAEVEDDGSDAPETEVRRRSDGNVFVKHRKITADLDVTDSMIVNLKNANYTNDYIATELRKNGLVPYDSKTVGSRYIRLQRKIAEREAQRLNDELTDWHQSDDETLLRADELALQHIEDTIRRYKAKRWALVSRNMHKIQKKDYKYGPKQCEKRFIELIDCHASIPIDIDDDPEERKAERAKRVLARMTERSIVEAREKAEKEEKRLMADQNNLRLAMEKSRRASERAERATKKAEAAQAKAQLQGSKHRALEMKRLTEEAQIIATSKRYAERNGLTYVAPRSESSRSVKSNSGSTLNSAASTPVPKIAKRKRSSMNPEAANSPRNHLSVKELGDLLSKRGLSKTGSKAEIIKRLADHDATLNPGTIVHRLSAYGVEIDTSTPKTEMIERLMACEVAASSWGKRHLDALDALTLAGGEGSHGTKRARVGDGVDEDGNEDIEGEDVAMSVENGDAATLGE